MGRWQENRGYRGAGEVKMCNNRANINNDCARFVYTMTVDFCLIRFYHRPTIKEMVCGARPQDPCGGLYAKKLSGGSGG